MLDQLAMKRTWESANHPYLFFNEDGATITPLGFSIKIDSRMLRQNVIPIVFSIWNREPKCVPCMLCLSIMTFVWSKQHHIVYLASPCDIPVMPAYVVSFVE